MAHSLSVDRPSIQWYSVSFSMSFVLLKLFQHKWTVTKAQTQTVWFKHWPFIIYPTRITCLWNIIATWNKLKCTVFSDFVSLLFIRLNKYKCHAIELLTWTQSSTRIHFHIWPCWLALLPSKACLIGFQSCNCNKKSYCIQVFNQ